MEKIPNREERLDILRIIATFAVIVLHVSAQNWMNVNVRSFEWNVFNLYDAMVRWAVPVFVMISGALFLNRNVDISRIYKKNIARMVAVFLLWSGIYALVELKINGGGMRKFIVQFVQGHFRMWFLFMIVGLYIIVPFMKTIVETENLVRYFLILTLIFTFIIPQVVSILTLIDGTIGTLVQGVYEKTNFYFTLGYTGYYILGYVLMKSHIPKKMERLLYILGIVGFAATIIFSWIASQWKQEAVQTFYGYLTINVMLESVAVFVFAKNSLKRWQFSDTAKKIIQNLSKYSFGVYLVYAMVFEELDLLFSFNTLSFNSLIAVPVLSVCVYFISLIIIGILKHIPIIKSLV